MFQRCKTYFSIAFVLCLFSLQAYAVNQANQSVDQFVQKFMHAYEQRDLQTIAKSYSPDAAIIGTGDDEILQGRDKILASFKRDFAQSQAATISIQPIAIHMQANTAMASYFVTVDVKQPNDTSFKSRLRFSLGLQKEHNHWVIVQSHLSGPLANQKAGESFPKNEPVGTSH